MTPRDERLPEAHEALGRMLIKCPIVFDQVQKRIVQEGPAFLDDLALRALDDKDHGRNPGDGWSNDLTATAGVDASANLEQNARVTFNSVTGRENPIPKADNRREGGFFMSEHRYWCAFSMASSSGEAASSGPVSFGLVSHPCCYLLATHAVRSVWQVNRPKEAHHA